jgi:hemolysin III
VLSRLREPVNGLTHLAAALAAAIGLGILVVLAAGDAPKAASLALYGVTLVLMFSASAAYHLAPAGPSLLGALRKLDHVAIYLLIAGTYTPVCLHYLTGFWRLGLPAIVWVLALVGAGVKLVVIGAPRWVTAGLYLLMGWLSLAAVGELLSRLPPGALAWLIAGGLFYTVGAVIYILKKPNLFGGRFGFHEIWHVFVILGAFSHFMLMAVYIAPAGAA